MLHEVQEFLGAVAHDKNQVKLGSLAESLQRAGRPLFPLRADHGHVFPGEKIGKPFFLFRAKHKPAPWLDEFNWPPISHTASQHLAQSEVKSPQVQVKADQSMILVIDRTKWRAIPMASCTAQL